MRLPVGPGGKFEVSPRPVAGDVHSIKMKLKCFTFLAVYGNTFPAGWIARYCNVNISCPMNNVATVYNALMCCLICVDNWMYILYLSVF